MKNKKKLITVLTAVMLLAVVGVGATLAYFTDNAETSNIVTMGKVDIRLVEHEVKKDENGKDYVTDAEKPVTEEGLTFESLVPGQTVPKDPTVEMQAGSADAYIRLKMTITPVDKDGEEIPVASKEALTGLKAADIELLRTQLAAQITAEGTKWYYNEQDEYFYYAEILKDAPDGNTATLFREVKIPAEWKNNTALQSFRIQLQAEAIQADNLETGIIKDAAGTLVTGWELGEIKIEEYKEQSSN